MATSRSRCRRECDSRRRRTAADGAGNRRRRPASPGFPARVAVCLRSTSSWSARTWNRWTRSSNSCARILAYVVPMALAIAGVGGWFLARQSLSPVVAMADRARRIGVENLSERLPVANPRDELGHLAETFNELLSRLETSLIQQRQFMADASHELRTPVTTTRTAASVTLQQAHRDEHEYRETLADRRAAGGTAVARGGRHVHPGAGRRRQLPDAHDADVPRRGDRRRRARRAGGGLDRGT